MNTETALAIDIPDPAAVFASALSLWQACQKRSAEVKMNISESYNGMDQFMREIMRAANQFEVWSCRHIDFNELNDVWPYLLEDKFGAAYLAILEADELAQFNEGDCLRVALQMELPVILADKLPIPIDLVAPNPVTGSGFRQFKIQTVRDTLEDGEPVPFVAGDEPADEQFGEPYFGLYGVAADGKLEHIADRKTYDEAWNLVQKIAPGTAFPSRPKFSPRRSNAFGLSV